MDAKEYVYHLLDNHSKKLDHIKRLEYEIRNFTIPNLHPVVIENAILSIQPGEKIHTNRISDKTADLAIDHFDGHRVKLLSLYKQLGELKADTERLEYNLTILGDPYCTVIRLYYFEGLSWPEIQNKLNRGLRTVKTYREKGICQLIDAYRELIRIGVITDENA